jgi:hypothetical protein
MQAQQVQELVLKQSQLFSCSEASVYGLLLGLAFPMKHIQLTELEMEPRSLIHHNFLGCIVTFTPLKLKEEISNS